MLSFAYIVEKDNALCAAVHFIPDDENIARCIQDMTAEYAAEGRNLTAMNYCKSKKADYNLANAWNDDFKAQGRYFDVWAR